MTTKGSDFTWNWLNDRGLQDNVAFTRTIKPCSKSSQRIMRIEKYLLIYCPEKQVTCLTSILALSHIKIAIKETIKQH